MIPGHPEIQITRDRYGVPHVVSSTHEGGVFAAGWIAAEDRGLLLQQARYNGRVAAIDVPGLSAIGLIRELQIVRAERADRGRGRASRPRLSRPQARRAGRRSPTSTPTSRASTPSTRISPAPIPPPFTRNDIYAINAVKAQFLGQGGGDEARRSQFLGGLQERLGDKKGKSVFNDLRQFKTKGSPVAVDGRFPYGSDPEEARRAASVLDPDSYEPVSAVAARRRLGAMRSAPVQASNTLMITKEMSATGQPADGRRARRSATSTPASSTRSTCRRPGLVWRGADLGALPRLPADRPRRGLRHHAHLGLRRHHRPVRREALRRQRHLLPLQGRVPRDGHLRRRHARRRAGQLQDHRPRAGRRLRDGRRQAGRDLVASARATARRSSTSSSTASSPTARCRDPKSFFKAANKTPQTFNSFYIDNKHVAEFTSGLLPIRPEERRSGPADQGHREVRVGGLPRQERPHRRASIPATGR